MKMRVGVSFVLESKLGAYMAAVRAAGLEGEPISPARRRALAGLRGLVLTGGGDVDPRLYGAEPHRLTAHVCRERDDLERELIEEAAREDLPVLGICRGLQILNVARGGTLLQHIEGHRDVDHGVHFEPDSRIAEILGRPEYGVNSRHHQAVERPGYGLEVTARAPDGTVEAVEDPSRRFLLAVQWHPEDRPTTPDRRVFAAFARAVLV